MQEHCHIKLLATLYSLLAAVLPFATRYSPFANSLFAVHYSLPFPDLPICRPADLPIRFGSAGASPSHFALVPRPTPLVPSEVGAQVLRDQQTEIRSMVWSWLHRQPQEFTA
jgi:hypothetical protein